MDDFVRRLRAAFGDGSMAEIARRLGVPHATVRNYFRGRLPAPEVLIKIAEATDISLNWLLTGKGGMYVSDTPRRASLDRLLDERIGAILDERLRTADSDPEFDVEAMVMRFDDPQMVMDAWFRHEGRDYPRDFGVVFFQGWNGFTAEEKLDAVRDAKKVLDRTMR
jgi:transcriptional regulator with XRE-family HTH domain